ncbi:hypothetical protein HPB47_020749 [Ixodes persulcatus]|uniref:Uncharacterized protein n=1 Tax=Ixodes persulcatus TaxID=34615 RepID=A0AC60QGQ0_IXOPE|nr:hypothetical protein HPB47_020749 [Ixodes persulcatus]
MHLWAWRDCSPNCVKTKATKRTCINVAPEDYDLLMKDGSSTYKCSSCTKRKGDKDNALSAAPSHLDAVSAKFLRDGSNEGDLRELIIILLNKIHGLSADVKSLKVDKESLRVQLAQNNALLRKSLPYVPGAASGSSSKTFSSVVQLPNARQPEAEATTSVLRQNPENASGSRPEKAHLLSRRRPTVDDEGYTLVRRKGRVKALEGSRPESRLSVVPRPPRKRALFVSRLSPTTTTSDVFEVIEETLQGKYLASPLLLFLFLLLNLIVLLVLFVLYAPTHNEAGRCSSEWSA